MPDSSLSPWRLDWTPQTTARFWNIYATHPPFRDRYFSLRVGPAVLAQLLPHLHRKALIVEIGAGCGDFTQQLLESRLQTLALDSSPQTVEALQARFGGHPSFIGAKLTTGTLPLEEARCANIILIETIEHLDDYAASSLLAEARRVLRVGGRILITTPNEEDLAAAEVLCPSCACLFHPVQHVRAFSAASLSARLVSAGFRVVHCQATYFSHLTGLRARLERVRRAIAGLSSPHLLCVAER